MILVLCGSIAAGCAIITLAYSAEKILERVVKPPRRRKRAARPGAEVIDLGKYRSWRDAVRVYETVTTDQQPAFADGRTTLKVVFIKLSAEIIDIPTVFHHSFALPVFVQLLHRLGVVVHPVGRLIVTTMAQRNDQSVALAFLAQRTAEYMVPLDHTIATTNKALTNHLAHSSFRASSLSGGSVSTPTARQSCTILSIKRAICALSYVLDP